MICELCGQSTKIAQKLKVDNDIFILCDDCRLTADDINTANELGEGMKNIVDKLIKKEKDVLH